MDRSETTKTSTPDPNFTKPSASQQHCPTTPSHTWQPTPPEAPPHVLVVLVIHPRQRPQHLHPCRVGCDFVALGISLAVLNTHGCCSCWVGLPVRGVERLEKAGSSVQAAAPNQPEEKKRCERCAEPLPKDTCSPALPCEASRRELADSGKGEAVI